VVLRTASELSSALCPAPSSLPASLPIFDYQFSSLLPGESTQYRFFEPRYRLLAEIARSGGGHFLLRTEPCRGGPAVLATIVDAEDLPAGDVTCRAIGGPLVSVEREDTVDVEGEGAHPLARAVRYRLAEPPGEDAGPDDPSLPPPEELRARILGQLGAVADLAAVVRRSGPPPLCPGAFSFWALRQVLGPEDVGSRQRWLYRSFPTERMSHVFELLVRHQAAAERARAGSGGNGAKMDASPSKPM